MAKSFSEGKRVLRNDGISCIIFAHKTTEGWESLLNGIINGGLTITNSWPIATERRARLLARETAALATSVHLICRPRSKKAPVGDWGEVLRELPKRVGIWMERLQNEGVRGADLVFACIGPALEIFSRYRKVETAEGKEVKLPVYLEKVWEVVGRIALENILGTDEAKARNGVAGALEEDARLTALFLWTLQSTKMDGKSNADQKDVQTDNEYDEEEAPTSKKAKGYSLVLTLYVVLPTTWY
jgi:putative DNA methylase